MPARFVVVRWVDTVPRPQLPRRAIMSDRRPTSLLIACRITAILTLGSANAFAAQVCSQSPILNLPATGEGLYINLVTNVSAPTEAGAPGFDFNPYAAQSSLPEGQLKFYWGPSSNNGAGVVTSGDTYAVLGGGQVIGPSSTFSRAALAGDTSAWQAGFGGFLGVRFQEEPSNALRYGWIRLTTSPPLGFPASVETWCYEDSGAAITTPVPTEAPMFANGFEA